MTDITELISEKIERDGVFMFGCGYRGRIEPVYNPPWIMLHAENKRYKDLQRFTIESYLKMQDFFEYTESAFYPEAFFGPQLNSAGLIFEWRKGFKLSNFEEQRQEAWKVFLGAYNAFIEGLKNPKEDRYNIERYRFKHPSDDTTI